MTGGPSRRGGRRMVVALLMAVVAVPAVLAAATQGAPQAPAPVTPGRFPDPPAADRATVWAVGDAKYSDAARAVARLVERGRPTRFLYMGDVYERGSAADFVANYDTVYGSLRDITLPTPGNHDWGRHNVGYDPYWSRVAGGPPPPYYAVSLAGWQVISLNSEMDHAPGSAQVRWLRGRVAGPGSCRIAFWHRPRYSAGTHGDQPDLQPFWNALIGRAVLVLNGHDHDMQRLHPHRGITELVSGAGGRGHYGVDAGDRRLAFSDDETDGALRLVLRPGIARYAFVSVSGRVLDSGVVRCRTAEADPPR